MFSNSRARTGRHDGVKRAWRGDETGQRLQQAAPARGRLRPDGSWISATMLRPMISNRTIERRARRTSPMRPALLVDPSRLLRGDKVRDPNNDRPRDQSPECGLLVAIAVAITQSAPSNPFQPPKQWAPGSIRIPVTRSCHDDYCVIQPDIPSGVHFPDVPCGSLAPLISTAYTSWLRGAKEESKVRSF